MHIKTYIEIEKKWETFILIFHDTFLKEFMFFPSGREKKKPF